jgi:hypothetical protein
VTVGDFVGHGLQSALRAGMTDEFVTAARGWMTVVSPSRPGRRRPAPPVSITRRGHRLSAAGQ